MPAEDRRVHQPAPAHRCTTIKDAGGVDRMPLLREDEFGYPPFLAGQCYVTAGARAAPPHALTPAVLTNRSCSIPGTAGLHRTARGAQRRMETEKALPMLNEVCDMPWAPRLFGAGDPYLWSGWLKVGYFEFFS